MADKNASAAAGAVVSAVAEAAKAICIDPKEREKRIAKMSATGMAMSSVPLPSVEKGELSLDGLDKLVKVQKDLRTLIKDYAKLIKKDAGVLKTISDSFKATDQSVG
jgi:hypothetical protein